MSSGIQKIFGEIGNYTTPKIAKIANTRTFYELLLSAAAIYQTCMIIRSGVAFWDKTVEIKNTEKEVSWTEKQELIVSAGSVFLNTLMIGQLTATFALAKNGQGLCSLQMDAPLPMVAVGVRLVRCCLLPKSLSEELEEAKEAQSVILLFKFQDKLRHAEKDLKNKKLWLRTPDQEQARLRRIASQLDRSIQNRFSKSLASMIPIRQSINDLANQLAKAIEAYDRALKIFQEKEAVVNQKEEELKTVQKKIQDYKRHIDKTEKARDETRALLIKERLSDTNNRIKTLSFQLNRIKQDPKQEKSVKILQQTIADLESTQQEILAEIDKAIRKKFYTIENDAQTLKRLELESTALDGAVEQAKVELKIARSIEQDCGVEQIRLENYLGMAITKAEQKIQEYVYALVYKSAFELYRTSDREDPLEFILEYVEQKAEDLRAQLLSEFAGAAKTTLQTSFDFNNPFSEVKIREI